MTATLAAAKHPGLAGTPVVRALAWLWHSDVAAITAVIHSHAPHPAQGAVLAVTVMLVIAIATRRNRKRPAS